MLDDAAISMRAAMKSGAADACCRASTVLKSHSSVSKLASHSTSDGTRFSVRLSCLAKCRRPRSLLKYALSSTISSLATASFTSSRSSDVISSSAPSSASAPAAASRCTSASRLAARATAARSRATAASRSASARAARSSAPRAC